VTHPVSQRCSRHLRHVRVVALAMAFFTADVAFAVDRYVALDAAADGPNHYRTIDDAMTALQPGDHLIIAAGLYRESILFPKRDWSAASPTVIEGRGRVVVDAADIVTGWTPAGNGVFYRDWPKESAQVSVDGKPLAQVGGSVFGGYPDDRANPLSEILPDSGGIWPGRREGDAATMGDGDFFYDRALRRLFLRTTNTDLSGHVVEVSSRAHSLLAQNVDFVQVHNLAFRHGNTSPTGRDALVTLSGRHIVVDHVSVEQADSVGIQVDGDDNIIVDSSAHHCGQLGMKIRGARVLIARNETDYNNTRDFNKWWEAGGVKFVGEQGLRDSIVTGHTAIGNRGDGIWFDWGMQDNRVENSVLEYNSGFGIQYEASSGAQIVGNRVIGNGQRGIYLPHSSHSVVRGNLIAANGLEGIAIVDEGRRDPTGKLDLQPRANAVLNNVVAWNGSALTVPSSTPDLVSDGNVFIGWGSQLRESAGWGHPFNSLAIWRRQVGLDKSSVRIERVIDPAFAASLQAKQRGPDLAWVDALRAMPDLPAAAVRTLRTMRVPMTDTTDRSGAASPGPSQPLSLDGAEYAKRLGK
jgi:hypothetical protein